MKNNIKKLLALVLAVCMTLALAACGAGSETEAAPTDEVETADTAEVAETAETAEAEEPAGMSDETLKVALDGEPSGLYPQYAYNNATGVVAVLMYDTLLGWDAENKCAVPNIATAWEWDDDTHLRLTLRDDVTFSDGTPLTAEDVVYSFQVSEVTGACSSSYSRIFDLENCVAEDDTTVVLALNSPYPVVIDILAADVYSIVSKAGVEAAGGPDEAARSPIGSGKYVFSEWVDGQYITLTRNDNYWNQDALPYYKEITLSFISDNTSRAMAVQSGNVDVACGLGTTQVEGLESDSAVTVVVENTSTNRTLYMNCSDDALADENVRAAIWNLLDADAIRAIANSGYGELSQTSFSQFCTVYKAPDGDFVREVDVDAAVELLAAAGYDESNPLTLKLMMPSEGDNEVMAQLVQAQLAKGGINVEIEMLEIMAFLTKLWSGDYQLTITSGDQYDYEKLLYMVDGRIDPATASGGAQYNDADLQALLDECYGETDDAARNELYGQIQDYLLDKHIVIGICNQVCVVAHSAAIEGVSVNLSSMVDVSGMHPVA